MPKELLELLNKIDAKKEEVRDLVDKNKLDEAKKAKEELKELSEKFNLLKDLEEKNKNEENENIKNKATKINNDENNNNILNAFTNAIKAAFTKRPLNEKDANILNSLNEGSETDGGLTVPKDLRTQIKELRRGTDALETLVNIEPVTTLSGARVIEINADQTPFDNIDEEAQFPEVATPTFKKVAYKVLKKGGILKITRELTQDSAENILAYLRKWIAKKSKATRNFLILAKLDSVFGKADKVRDITSIDDLKSIFNVELDPSIAVSASVLTNQDGFNWLDTLKDSDGKYILQPNPALPTQNLLFGKYPIIRVSNKTLKTVTGKAPIYCGDFKEAITVFDRETLSIEFSTEAGDLWGKDLTGIKVRERLDVQAVDEEAVIKGTVTITPAKKTK